MKPEPPADFWEKMDKVHESEGLNSDDLGVTVEQYAKQYGFSANVARHRLGRMVESGKLIRGKRFENGIVRVVYRPAE